MFLPTHDSQPLCFSFLNSIHITLCRLLSLSLQYWNTCFLQLIVSNAFFFFSKQSTFLLINIFLDYMPLPPCPFNPLCWPRFSLFKKIGNVSVLHNGNQWSASSSGLCSTIWKGLAGTWLPVATSERGEVFKISRRSLVTDSSPKLYLQLMKEARQLVFLSSGPSSWLWSSPFPWKGEENVLGKVKGMLRYFMPK